MGPHHAHERGKVPQKGSISKVCSRKEKKGTPAVDLAGRGGKFSGKVSDHARRSGRIGPITLLLEIGDVCARPAFALSACPAGQGWIRDSFTFTTSHPFTLNQTLCSIKPFLTLDQTTFGSSSTLIFQYNILYFPSFMECSLLGNSGF